MRWYLEALKKYAVFRGRARRAEFWLFWLFSLLAVFVLALIDDAIGLVAPGSNGGLLSGLYSAGVLIPSLAVSVRRLHDTNRSGWWLFIILVPLVGAIFFLVLMAREGDPGDNQYGPQPEEADAGPSAPLERARSGGAWQAYFAFLAVTLALGAVLQGTALLELIDAVVNAVALVSTAPGFLGHSIIGGGPHGRRRDSGGVGQTSARASMVRAQEG